jgi:hypothetical protein
MRRLTTERREARRHETWGREADLSHHKITHDICKHSSYSDALMVAVLGFFSLFLKRFFQVKIFMFPAVIFFHSSLLPIA